MIYSKRKLSETNGNAANWQISKVKEISSVKDIDSIHINRAECPDY